jgi:hypothetical protein
MFSFSGFIHGYRGGEKAERSPGLVSYHIPHTGAVACPDGSAATRTGTAVYYHQPADAYLFSHSLHHSHHVCSRRKTLRSVVVDSADAARFLPSTCGGFGRCETNDTYRSMILHNRVSGLAARLALREELREASTPWCRRQSQLETWLAKFVSALLVSVTRPLLLTT